VIYVKDKYIYKIKWLFNAGNVTNYEFSFFGCDGGLRRFFLDKFSLVGMGDWDEWLSILTYAREFLSGTNGFLSKAFFFN